MRTFKLPPTNDTLVTWEHFEKLQFKLKHQKMLLDILNRHVNDLSKRVAKLESRV